MERLDIAVLAVQETECAKQEKKQHLQSISGKQFFFIHTGVQKGVGFIISSKIQPACFEDAFEEVCPRILKFNFQKQAILSVYCPPDKKDSSAESWENRKFFHHLHKCLEKIKSSFTITVLGDFNCTLRKKHYFPPYVGQFGLRNNFAGDSLLKMNADSVFELVCTHKLRIINTQEKKQPEEISTYEPIQIIKTTDELEKKLHVKDLILSNSRATHHQVVHVQAVNHTSHHLVFYDLEWPKLKHRRSPNPRKLCAQPLRIVKGTLGETKLRDIDTKYPDILEERLKVSCLPILQKSSEDANLSLLYETITNSIFDTCKRFEPKPSPKMSWCSSRTAVLCKEKNAAWAAYIKTHHQAQKMSYQILSKQVKLSVKSDKKLFQAQQRVEIERHKIKPISVADNVSLFFPTTNRKTIVKSFSALPLMMRATSQDQLQPVAQAVKTHLEKIYAPKNCLWNSPYFQFTATEKERIQACLNKRKLPSFRPPMNTKAPGIDGIYLHNLKGAEKHLERLLEIIEAQGKTPEQFKYSLVHPLFKKGSRNILDCYRTLALRPIISNYLFRAYLPTCGEITKLSVPLPI